MPPKPDTKAGVYFEDPALPEGWTRKCVQRASGLSAGKWDVYVYNPMGKKFRSQNEVRVYLNQISSDLSPELFCFNAYSIAGMASARKHTPGKAVGKATPKSVSKPGRKAGRKPGPKPGRKPGSKSAPPPTTKTVSKPLVRTQTPKTHKPAGSGIDKAAKIKFNFGTKRTLAKPTSLPRPAKPVPPVKSPGIASKTRWSPPESPYDLIQETYHEDPWKLLVATMFISKPSDESPDDVWGDPPPVLESRRARPLLEKFFGRWPTAKAARNADRADVRELIEPLRLGDETAQLIVRFSDEYVNSKYKLPTELSGVGRLGNDSYRIFVQGQWKQVRPKDHMLSIYHNWLYQNYRELKLE